jgi:hypothetical protein
MAAHTAAVSMSAQSGLTAGGTAINLPPVAAPHAVAIVRPPGLVTRTSQQDSVRRSV